MLIRLPLILNAEDHLDSDLAVDGLTLLEATQGHWRWHYPGTPHIGTPAVLLSWVQAKVWGANPITLVSGGTVAACLIVVGTFVLAWQAFGHRVAAWGLIPSLFASAGTVWLSGRITGGHLLVTAWFAGMLTLLVACWQVGGSRRAFCLGLGCGFGFYIDSMLAVLLVAMVPSSVLIWYFTSRSRIGLLAGLIFLVGLLVGDLPREIGRHLEPYDSYQGQFDPLWQRDVLKEHTRILFAECLPRLIGGHPGMLFGPEPPPTKLAGRVAAVPKPPAFDPLSAVTTTYALVLFAVAMIPIGRKSLLWSTNPAQAGLCLTLLLVMAEVIFAFIINRNIFNSDNYRYLVFLLIPWSLGFGLLMDRLSTQGPKGMMIALLLSITLSALMTVDLFRWYRQYGWIDTSGAPQHVESTDPAIIYMRSHPEIRRIHGDYWDVYRLSFLTGGRLLPRPLAIYPDRYPESKAKDTSSEVYLIARGGRVPSEGWESVATLRGMQIVRWARWAAPQNRQPWD